MRVPTWILQASIVVTLLLVSALGGGWKWGGILH
jgi:hypothetical protein